MSNADELFPLTMAQLTGNYCETLTYGIYLVTCCFCARTLLFTTGPEERLRRPNEIRWFMVAVFSILFVVSTYDDIIGLIHNFAAFVKYTGPGGAEAELTNLHDWINITRSVAQVVNMIVGDFVLIYRCFIVYARRWPVVFCSGVLYLGGVAMALKLIVVEITTSNAASTLNSSQIEPWWSAFFAITAAQNILTTSLLVWRIWRVEHQNDRFRGTRGRSVTVATHQPRLRKVIRVIAESGLAYTTMVFMTFVVSICKSNALYPLSDATLQSTGITFNVIIVRSSPRRDEQFTVFDTNDRAMAEQGQGPLKQFSSLHFLGSTGKTTQSNTISGVNINLSVVKSTDESQAETDVDTENFNETYTVKSTEV